MYEGREQVAQLDQAITSRSSILLRLGEVTKGLILAHRELALLFAQEKRAKVETWVASQSTTVNGRDREADYNALSITEEIFNLKGDIAALAEERDFLRLYLGALGGD